MHNVHALFIALCEYGQRSLKGEEVHSEEEKEIKVYLTEGLISQEEVSGIEAIIANFERRVSEMEINPETCLERYRDQLSHFLLHTVS